MAVSSHQNCSKCFTLIPGNQTTYQLHLENIHQQYPSLVIVHTAERTGRVMGDSFDFHFLQFQK